MKKIYITVLFFIALIVNVNSIENIKSIREGNVDAKIEIIVYESLTCSHCANFHKNVYPDLKKEFIDKGIVQIEFRNFPLDIAALNASKIAHCNNDGNSKILHLLFKNQNKWANGTTIEELNINLKNLLNNLNVKLNFEKCINDKLLEDYILEDRINGVKTYEINSTPTLIINNKKFEKSLTYKNLEKALKKLI